MPWVEKLLMILGKIWTQFLLEENYGCAIEQIYLFRSNQYKYSGNFSEKV